MSKQGRRMASSGFQTNDSLPCDFRFKFGPTANKCYGYHSAAKSKKAFMSQRLKCIPSSCHCLRIHVRDPQSSCKLADFFMNERCLSLTRLMYVLTPTPATISCHTSEYPSKTNTTAHSGGCREPPCHDSAALPGSKRRSGGINWGEGAEVGY